MSNVSRRSSGEPSRRRANGTGSVSLRPDGAYDTRVSLPSGRRRRRVVRRLPEETKVQHRRRAEGVLREMLAASERGQVVASSHLTVAAYAERWLAQEAAKSASGRGLAPSTLDFYRQILGYYVKPLVGSRSVAHLTTHDVEQMMNTLSDQGRSVRTVQASRNVLGRILGSAKRDGLIADVVTEHASRVRRTLAEGDGPISKALDPDQLRALFEVAGGTRWEALIAVLALLGLRRGEALGLSWADVDFEARVISIRRSLARLRVNGKTQLVLSPTKTRSSRRPLGIPSGLEPVLRAWRCQQATERLRAGSNWGGRWVVDDLVFTTPLGTPVDPDNLRHALDRLGRRAGIGHIHPHQLRHSVASVLIDRGHTAAEVARVLGHSSPAVTMSFYVHAFDRAALQAAETVSAAIVGSRSRPADRTAPAADPHPGRASIHPPVLSHPTRTLREVDVPS